MLGASMGVVFKPKKRWVSNRGVWRGATRRRGVYSRENDSRYWVGSLRLEGEMVKTALRDV